MPIAQPTTTLQAIQTKVRRLTRSPSENQLSDADLQNYINTFVVYDFPEHLRMYILRVPFSFWCNPYQDVYPTDILSYGSASNASKNPLYNFENMYISIHDPVYIAGYQSWYSQSREQFYGIYPLVNSIATIGPTGNGSSTTFSGVINTSQTIVPMGLVQQASLLKNNVLFSSIDVNGNGLSMIDSPILDSITGNPTVWGTLYASNNPPSNLPLVLAAPYTTDPGFTSSNFINYVTGQFTVTFPLAPANGVLINSQTVPEIVAIPQAMLYFDNQITLRPVPDQPYQVNFEAYIRPTALLSTTQSPTLNEWWQYIAYGAAKKIFEDRMDMDSVQLIMPEYRKQETLCLRRTIVQNTNERTATIYTEQVGFSNNFGWGFGGGGGTF